MFSTSKEIAKVAIVANTESDYRYAESAKKTYLQNMDISICDSIEDAYAKLTGDSE